MSWKDPGALERAQGDLRGESTFAGGSHTIESGVTKFTDLTRTGTFRPSSGANKAKGIEYGRGAFVARYSGRAKHESGKGSASGFVLVDLKRGADGMACLKFEGQTSNFAQKVSGDFRLVGGTKRASKRRGGGTFVIRGPDHKPRASGKGPLRKGPRKALPNACKQLKGLLPQ